MGNCRLGKGGCDRLVLDKGTGVGSEGRVEDRGKGDGACESFPCLRVLSYGWRGASGRVVINAGLRAVSVAPWLLS